MPWLPLKVLNKYLLKMIDSYSKLPFIGHTRVKYLTLQESDLLFGNSKQLTGCYGNGFGLCRQIEGSVGSVCVCACKCWIISACVLGHNCPPHSWQRPSVILVIASQTSSKLNHAETVLPKLLYIFIHQTGSKITKQTSTVIYTTGSIQQLYYT